jgi:hypothetical protein
MTELVSKLLLAAIPTVPALAAFIWTIRNQNKIHEVHVMLNSRMDAWMKVTADQATQAGEAKKMIEIAQVKAASLISIAEIKADALISAARPVAAAVVTTAQPVALALRTAAEMRAATDMRTAADIKVAAMSTLDIVDHAKATVRNAGLPSYKDGIASVPETGPAIVHEGEQIISKADKKARKK